MHAAVKAEMEKIIAEMMKNPTVEIKLYRGMKQTDKRTDSSASYIPTEAKTIVIEVNGGSNNVLIQSLKTEDDE